MSGTQVVSDYTAKEKMLKQMVDDLGLQNLTYATINHIPSWLYDICDELIRKGWRKNEDAE